jgi:hypothetical protein
MRMSLWIWSLLLPLSLLGDPAWGAGRPCYEGCTKAFKKQLEGCKSRCVPSRKPSTPNSNEELPPCQANCRDSLMKDLSRCVNHCGQ